MADRLRALLDRPLDADVARAILACAVAIFLGVAGLLALAGSEPDRPAPQGRRAMAPPASSVPTGRVEAFEDKAAEHRRQDPQDEEGSAAARHAGRALRMHRALQHVPYRDGTVRIVLVGARGSRAVLRVDAVSVTEARRGWRRFLRRFHDAGRSYVPVFAATPVRRSRGGA